MKNSCLDNSNLTEITLSVKHVTENIAKVLIDEITKDILSENTLCDIKSEEALKVYIQKGKDVVSFEVANFTKLEKSLSYTYDVELYNPHSIKNKPTIYDIETSMCIKNIKKDDEVPSYSKHDSFFGLFEEWKSLVGSYDEKYELDEVIIRNKADGKLFKVTGLKNIKMEE